MHCLKYSKGLTSRIPAALLSLAVGSVGMLLPAPNAVADTSMEASSQIERKGCPQVDPDENLEALGIVLSPPAQPIANFVPAVRVGKLMYLSGNGPRLENGSFIKGKVGSKPGQLPVDAGYEAARVTMINQLAVLKAELGELKKVKRIVKVFGMVNSDSDFTDHPRVINGGSDLLVEVFGECGKHARSAVGMVSLPFNIAVEIDMVVELR